jgi:general secretion pathway protein I
MRRQRTIARHRTSSLSPGASLSTQFPPGRRFAVILRSRTSNIERRTSNVERGLFSKFDVGSSMFNVRFSFPGSAWECTALEALPRFKADVHAKGCDGVTKVSPTNRRRGLSLFEVIIALAIFMCSIAAIGQLVSSGVRAAVQARLQSQAVLRAETKMAEVVAGITGLHGGSSGTFTDDQTWSWSVAATQSQHEGLYLVEVTAAHAGMTTAAKQSYTLRRLIRDPQIALDEYAKEQEEAANGTGTSGSGSTSSGNSSSGGGSSGGSK